ncbi:MAG: hypothetical protein J5680_02140 [Neisseriaceae bacterium]|nr:hypothetical protein [Neisseriaceae bacterium]MBR5675786.1 hypothetical protein [Neisseriaceae bacterium]
MNDFAKYLIVTFSGCLKKEIFSVREEKYFKYFQAAYLVIASLRRVGNLLPTRLNIFSGSLNAYYSLNSLNTVIYSPFPVCGKWRFHLSLVHFIYSIS